MLAALVAAALAMAPPTGFTANAQLSDVGSSVAGHQITVYCADSLDAWQASLAPTTPRDTYGYVLSSDPTSAYLQIDACLDLATLAGDPNPSCEVGSRDQVTFTTKLVRVMRDGAMRTVRRRVVVRHRVPVLGPCPSWNISYALMTLVHEAVHDRGISDEAVTDCTALQLVTGAAEELGSTPATARAIALQDVAAYQRKQVTAPAYYSSECRDGGALDINPQSSTWP